MPTSQALGFTGARLDPVLGAADALASLVRVLLPPNVSYAQGTILGELTATPGTYKAYAPAPSIPAAPVLSTATTGGTVAAATYGAEVTYVNALGETVASAPASITTTGTTSTITVDSPAASGNATGYNVYMTQGGGATYTKQNATPIALGTNFTLTAPPTSTGAAPPAGNTTTDGSQTPAVILAYAAQTDASGDLVNASEWPGVVENTVPAYTQGTFRTQDLTGLDANAVTKLAGALLQGPVSGPGLFKF